MRHPSSVQKRTHKKGGVGKETNPIGLVGILDEMPPGVSCKREENTGTLNHKLPAGLQQTVMYINTDESAKKVHSHVG